MSLKTKIFERIHQGSLVYNTCWEDPRCDRALLRLTPQSKVVMLTSAGCNALDYLLDNPKSIDCIDVNPRQNALLELKQAFYRCNEYDGLNAFFGRGWHNDPYAIFYDALEPQLDEYARDYWKKNLRFFSGKGLRKRFYYYGSSGLVAFFLKNLLQKDSKTASAVREMFETDDLYRQRNLYYRIEPVLLNRITVWVLNSHVVQSLLGVPSSQQIMARRAYKDGMTGYFRHCLRHVFTRLPLCDNYFWRLYFFGTYTESCAPNYLDKANFHSIRNSIAALRTHTGTLSAFLQHNPGFYTHFVLLDHQDWMVEHDPSGLEEEWRLILQNAAPGARILLRSAAPDRSFVPSFVETYGHFDTTSVQHWHLKDRVGTYASTHLFIKH